MSVSLDSEDFFSDGSFDDHINEVLDSNANNNINRPSPSPSPNPSPQSANPVIKYREIPHPIHEYKAPITIKKYLNYDNLNTIIYPTNFPVRDYQLEIVQKALFKNILCAIPTGLGKTFIASTVMLNFFNWTTEEMKIIFMAPTKPLVAQQIKAFIEITGISMDYIDILLDKLKKNRKLIWNSKRIFFTTPQVVENDLKSGILNPELISCLIIDEAHRATGNYAYTNVIKYIHKFNGSFRVVALTATPGSNLETVQNVVTNLNITEIDLRTENDPNIAKYIKSKIIDKLDCEQTDQILTVIDLLSDAIRPVLEKANDAGIYDITDPAKINHFMAMEKSQKIIKNPTIPEGLKWSHYFTLQLLGMVGQCLRRLNIYGLRVFYNYFLEKYNEFTTKYNNKKSTNKLAASFYYDKKIKHLLQYVENLFKDDKLKADNDLTHIEGLFSHTKLNYLLDELIFFFRSNPNSSSSCIIFTEYRESALEITRVLENANKTIGKDMLRPHIFIGQSKERDKFDEDVYLDKIKPKRKKAAKETKTKTKTDLKQSASRPSDRLGSSENAQSKGMNQKTQKELIENFKNGNYNILIATSIGEEGLDIGEVDLIVCFDSTQSPIKNIQRMGRTGRKRDGRVLLLFSSNERSKFDSAMDKYEWIQNQIKNSENIEFFNPSNNRIVPDNINPTIEKKFIDIPKENKSLLIDSDVFDTDEFLKLATQSIQKNAKKKTTTATTTAKSKLAKSKPKAVDDPRQMKLEKRFFMPQNMHTGFKSVSEMVEKVAIVDGSEVTTKSYISRDLSTTPEASNANTSNQINQSIDLTNDSDFSDSAFNVPTAAEDDDVDDVDDDDDGEISILNANVQQNISNGDKNIKVFDIDDVSKPQNTKSNIYVSNTNSNNNQNIKSVSDANINGNVCTNHENTSSSKATIDFDAFSDDDFSDVSFGELERNAYKPPPTPVQPSLPDESTLKRKRPIADLSSDVFSDDLDDEFNNLDNLQMQRPAKR